MKLFEIAADIRSLFDNLETDEIPPEVFEKIQSLQLAADVKVDSICSLIREWTTEAAAAKEEKERLAKLQQARENRAARLKEYLMQCLKDMGETRHETDRFVARIQKNPPAAKCIVDNPEHLGLLFQRRKIEPDCAKALAHFKETGYMPDGFEFHQGEHLRIQ